MTPEERFQFDLEGYLVVENVLDDDHLAELNAPCDNPPGVWEDEMYRTSDVSQWGAAYQRLIDHPKLVPYLLELLGPQVRLDHDYCILMRKGAAAGGLHGGSSPQIGAGDHWYRHHNGVMRNGLTVVTFNLTESPEGKGGFGCIPGSHKSNFVGDIPREVCKYERDAHYVRNVPAGAGDVIIFTEALVHGTVPWEAEGERRAVLYKYSPGHSSWSRSYYDQSKYTALTDQQKRFLAPPYAGRRENTVSE